MFEFLWQPWPWYVSGPLIGLMVPLLLLIDGKQFGLSSNLRHICSMCVPNASPFFQYDWKKERWNLLVFAGILLGGAIAGLFLTPTVNLSAATLEDLKALGLQNLSGIGPQEIFSWEQVGSLRTLIFVVMGGFLVGFGSRYGDGCTSGHAIMGLSMMNWPSLIAIVGFFIGGLLVTHLLLPFLIAL
jgi:hypothetical protein